MAVIINEFEVIPERQDEPQGTPSAERKAPPTPVLTAAELERVARVLWERLERARAH